MPSVVCRNTVLITELVNHCKTTLGQCCLLRAAAEEVKERFPQLADRSRVNVVCVRTLLHWLLSQCNRPHCGTDAAIIGLASRGILLDHREEVVVLGSLAEEVLKHIAGGTDTNG